MDYDALKVFVHLAETLHYAKTSKACNMSPSTLSRTIKRLEHMVGFQLFERDNRSVQLTDTGLQFKKYAREALARWEAFHSGLAGRAEVLAGEITMYCTVTASYGILPDILARFRTSYPQVNIKLLTGGSESALQKMIAGEADCAVAALPDKIPDRLCFKRLTDILLQCVAPVIPWPQEDLLQARKVPWEKMPFIIAERGMARKRIDAWFQAKKIKPHIYAQVTGNESILALVSLGFGIGIVPHLVIEKNMLNSSVRVVDIQPPIKPYSVGICVQKRRMANPLIRAFWQTI